jgi:hypothetical protein
MYGRLFEQLAQKIWCYRLGGGRLLETELQEFLMALAIVGSDAWISCPVLFVSETWWWIKEKLIVFCRESNTDLPLCVIFLMLRLAASFETRIVGDLHSLAGSQGKLVLLFRQTRLYSLRIKLLQDLSKFTCLDIFMHLWRRRHCRVFILTFLTSLG